MYEEYKEKNILEFHLFHLHFPLLLVYGILKQTNKQTNKDIGQKQISSDIVVVINSKENINLKIQILKGCTL